MTGHVNLSVLRFDDEMLVTPILAAGPGAGLSFADTREVAQRARGRPKADMCFSS